MDIQQEINIRILEGLNQQEIKLALPSMVLARAWMNAGDEAPTQRLSEA